MVEFKTEIYGADVATIRENDEQIVEVARRKDGLFDLTIHRRRPDSDRWDDMTATLPAIDFIKLGEVADACLCVEPDCPYFGAPVPEQCRCHPKYQRTWA